ncbi:MAG: ATP-binding protein [Proteobacteria bacterium]|nr:ATP-binding protein [Pseudomonadota bacterium]
MNRIANSNNTISVYYRPGFLSLDRLAYTSVGQQEILAGLLKKLEKQAAKKQKRNSIYVGPPGIGKTHFIKILAKSIQRSKILNQHYTLIPFPVDNYRILSLADFLLCVVRILGDVSGDEHWSTLYGELEEADEDSLIIETVLSHIVQYHKTSGHTLLILVENLHILINEQSKRGLNVQEFAEFLTNIPSISIVGTYSACITETENFNHPFGDNVELHLLEELTLEQTKTLIKKNLEWDDQKELLNQFNDLIPKIQALHLMTGGNPRLCLILYELIVNEDNLDINRQFEKLLDQVSPFYQERIRILSAQERALLATLSSLRSEIKTPTIVAKKMRISSKQSSTLFSKLLSQGFLKTSNHPTDKRSKIVIIKEGFFDLWLAIGQLQDPKKFLPLLAEFLEKWYSEKLGRERKRRQLWSSLQLLDNKKQKSDVENAELFLSYLADMGTDEEKIQNKMELILYYLSTNKAQMAETLLQEIDEQPHMRSTNKWMIRQIRSWDSGDAEPTTLQHIRDILNCWRYQRAGESEKVVALSLKLAGVFSRKGEHRLNISFLKESLKHLNSVSHQILLLEKIAVSQENLGKFSDTLKTWTRVLGIAEKSNDLKSQGTILNNISQIYQDQGDFDTALDHLNRSLDILQEINDYNGQTTTLNNISTVYFAQGYYEKALECLEQALAITERTGNRSIEGITLSNIALIYQARNDFDKALDHLERSLVRMRETGNRHGEGTTLHNISQIHMELDDLENSLKYLEQSLVIMKEIDSDSGTCYSLFNLGKILWKMGKKEMAISNWVTVFQIASNINQVEILEQLKRLADSIGENGLDFWKKNAKKDLELEFTELSS